MRFSLLLSLLVFLSAAFALSGVKEAVGHPISQITRSTNDKDVENDRGCGIFRSPNSDVGQVLQGNNQCMSSNNEISSYMIGQGCVCYFFNASGCNLRSPNFVRWATGQSKNSLPSGVKWYTCRGWF